ncbi:MAG: hypothetical protein AAF771_08920 [Pseudomonadota bacterium]
MLGVVSIREEVRTFFEEQAALFTEGDLAALADYYELPLAVFTPDALLLETSVEDTIRAIGLTRTAAWAKGAVQVRCELLEISGDMAMRFPVRLRWHYEGADGRGVGVSEVIYYCASRANGSLAVQMVEIVKLAFPEVVAFLRAPPTEH